MVVLSQACALLVRVKQLGMKIALATSSDKEHLGHCGKLVDMDDRVDEALVECGCEGFEAGAGYLRGGAEEGEHASGPGRLRWVTRREMRGHRQTGNSGDRAYVGRLKGR